MEILLAFSATNGRLNSHKRIHGRADGDRHTFPSLTTPGVTHWNGIMVIADGILLRRFPASVIVSSGPHQLSQVAEGNVNNLGLVNQPLPA